MPKTDNNIEYKNVWVFAEQRDGKLMDVSLELLGEGKILADKLNQKVCAVLLGENLQEMSEELIAYGADIVYVCDDKNLKNYTTDVYTKVITSMINAYNPDIFLIGATHIGRDLAPRISARVNTGLTADCTNLEIDETDKKLLQTRPAFGGNIMATIICPNHKPQMATVRPGVMEKNKKNDSNIGEIIDFEINLELEDIKTKILKTVKEKKNNIDIQQAEIIVAGGRGVGNKEGFDLLKKLADKLGGVLGASRSAVDNGWIDHSHQVGQTGKTVRPKLYIACGISGAIQHIAGMQDAECVVVINKNKNAPIFKVADYGIVGDYKEIVNSILKILEK